MKLKRILLATILTLTVLLPTLTANALTAPYTTKRLGGQTRFNTAIEISKEFVAKARKPVDTVILCTADGYADSVSVTPFAVYVNAPILLTATDTLTPSTKKRISEMAVKKIYVIGGTGVISDNVMTQLTNMGVSVERIGGTNRFATNQAILAKIPQTNWGPNPKFVNAYDPYCGLAVSIDTVDKDNTQLVNPIIFCSDTVDGYHYDSTNNKTIITTLSNTYGKNFTPYASEYYYTYQSGTDFFGGKKYATGVSPMDLYDTKDTKITTTIGIGPSYFLASGGVSGTQNLQSGNDIANIDVTLSINTLFAKRFNSHPYSTNNAMITTGSNYIDAIAAGPLSAITYCPIVFKGDYGHYSSKDYIDVQNIYYIGGNGVVPDGSESIIK